MLLIKKYLTTFFLISLLLYGCGPTGVKKLSETGADQLTASEILTLVDNNTLFIHSFGEDSYLYFDHSSKLFGKDIYNNKDIGKWDVSEAGELCLRMDKWWYGDMRCFHVLRTEDQYHLANATGVLEYSAEQSIGDAKSLYYAVKKKRKSHRRSVRSQSTQTQSEQSGAAEPVSQPESASAKTIVEESYSTPESGNDLRSTVKWMARDCPGCNLANTDLKKADLVGANLAGANLRGANLRMANLRRADLQGANLEDAVLAYTNLPGANLKGANLRGAVLKGANLLRADLTGADLTGADLTDAHLESVIGLKQR